MVSRYEKRRQGVLAPAVAQGAAMGHKPRGDVDISMSHAQRVEVAHVLANAPSAEKRRKAAAKLKMFKESDAGSWAHARRVAKERMGEKNLADALVAIELELAGVGVEKGEFIYRDIPAVVRQKAAESLANKLGATTKRYDHLAPQKVTLQVEHKAPEFIQVGDEMVPIERVQKMLTLPDSMLEQALASAAELKALGQEGLDDEEDEDDD